MTRKDSETDARLARIERILLALSAQQFGVALGAAQGVDWPTIRRQALRDAMAILDEQQQPPMETRGAA